MLPPLLTKSAIHEAIDQTCKSLNEQKDCPADGWALRRATQRDFHQHHHQAMMMGTQGREDNIAFEEALLYGLVAKKACDKMNVSGILATFYFAYSTWDGKFLYLDHWPATKDPSVDAAVQTFLYRALAQIAVRLQCARFTWQHYNKFCIANIPKPTTLDGWLTLHWQADSIRHYLARQPGTTKKLEQRHRPIKDVTKVKDVINECLNVHSHDKFNLRLATAQDVNTIGRLVQGLADFENEPDAVHVTVDHYRQDGFKGQPLFYCLLLDHVNEDKSTYTCGMALCYIGYRLADGIFLYLEDLFIEKEYRGKGAGTFIMSTLAYVGYSLDCSRLVWQALVSEWKNRNNGLLLSRD